jgi:hypothetical protein
MLRRDRDRMSPGNRPAARRAVLVLALAAVAILGGCAATRRQQVASGLPSKHAVRSHQVLLLADGEIPNEEQVLAELGQIRERLLTEFDVPPGEREVVVYLFADRDRYAKYMYEHHPNLPARRAFFIGTPKELAVYAHWGEHILTDLRHEYTHGLLHSSVGHVPLWLDEGIAEYMEVGETSPDHINPEHVGRLADAAAHGWRPDLASLERLEQVDEMHTEHYQEAWAWVHYLQHSGPEGKLVLSNYLAGLRRNQSPPLISQTIGQSLPAAEVQLAQYVSQLGLHGGVQPAAFQATSPGAF